MAERDPSSNNIEPAGERVRTALYWQCPGCSSTTVDRPRRNEKCECGRRRRAMRACACGNTFHVGRLDAKFCSRSCSCRFGAPRKRGKSYPHLRRAAVRICPTCKAEFRAVKDFAKRKAQFCSRPCWLRSKPETDIEKRVRLALERMGVEVVRQHVLGPWMVDFYVPPQRTVIEADGGYWHRRPEVAAKDRRKDAWMAEQGYTIVHIPEKEIMALGAEHTIRMHWAKAPRPSTLGWLDVYEMSLCGDGLVHEGTAPTAAAHSAAGFACAG